MSVQELFSGNVGSIVSFGPYNFSFPGGHLVARIAANSMSSPRLICRTRFHVRVIESVIFSCIGSTNATLRVSV